MPPASPPAGRAPPPYAASVDLTGPLADRNANLPLVRDAAVPLPELLAALLVEITQQLTATDRGRAAGRAARRRRAGADRHPRRAATTVASRIRARV
ncbi:hypothetical protein [Streptomyces sp. NPDC059552]|uniref:hypothetical protein n=1 Tax=Streptomyces sp. NPDC059552 TaxID=3346862 RepID=UPI003682DC07